MSRARKTVDLEALVAIVNRRNAASCEISPDIRKGWNLLLEEALHNANAYAGFRYLGETEVPEGAEPGIRAVTDGASIDDAYPCSIANLNAGTFTFPDDTRRAYFIDTKARTWKRMFAIPDGAQVR